MKKIKLLLMSIILTSFAQSGFGQLWGDFVDNYLTPAITSSNPSDFSAAGVMYISIPGKKGYVTVNRKSSNIILQKTNTDGVIQWTKTIVADKLPNISFDSDNTTGDVYLACVINSALHIIKFDPSGAIVFSKRTDNEFNYSLPYKTKVLELGRDKYVVTLSINTSSNLNFLTMSTDGIYTHQQSLSRKCSKEAGVTFVQHSNGNLLMFQMSRDLISGNVGGGPSTYSEFIDCIEVNPLTGYCKDWTYYLAESDRQMTYITDVIKVPTAIGDEYLLSCYVKKGSTKTSMLVAFDSNRGYLWSEKYPKLRHINALINDGGKINGVAMSYNGEPRSVAIGLNPSGNGTSFVNSTKLVVYTNPVNLWMSLPYTFDYGVDGYPIISTESGHNDLFPLFSLNANNNLTACKLKLETYSNEYNEIGLYGFQEEGPTSINTYDANIQAQNVASYRDLICHGEMNAGGPEMLTNGNLEPIDRDQKLVAKMQLYPNPSNGSFTVSYNAENEGVVSMKVYDITGSVVYEKTAAKQNGSFQHVLTHTGLSEGIYILRLEINGEVKQQRFIIE